MSRMLIVCMTLIEILFLCACSSNKAIPNKETDAKESKESIEMEKPATSEGTENFIDVLPIGSSFSDMQLLASGELIYEITGAHLVDDIAEIPALDDFMDEEFLVLDADNHWITQDVPNFVNHDMRVQDGNYLVLVDVTVKNNGARCYTTADLDDDGISLGHYSDPYLFRADMLFLTNTRMKDEVFNTAYDHWNMNYYSLKDDHPEYPSSHATYHLEPGDTIKFTLGYHLSDTLYQNMMTKDEFFSNLCITANPFEGGTFVNLSLGAE